MDGKTHNPGYKREIGGQRQQNLLTLSKYNLNIKLTPIIDNFIIKMWVRALELISKQNLKLLPVVLSSGE
ncbi:hypothetical protein BJP34_28845 [Moorena producens PAL-8-15-08-1]|uniref:Uncharacterized protein n=1 Tax=Moorena producens PAL-8-15-08-1 TaxID=1458985 RepID=A0A1D8TZA9_9CYAN|nr:hypothetical protein BJP34_28845 [Moorena producens PAL-8-15-08-1]